MDWVDWSVMVVRVVLVFFVLLIAVLLYIWMERKVIADMQTRVGPMRAGPRGMLVTLADGIKLFFKEGITPTNADRPVYLIAPILAMFPGFLAFCTIPFGEPVELFGRVVPFQITDLNIGILWVLAMTSIGVYGVVLAGWSSGSNYPLLGSVRSSAQMISYEVGMGLALVAVIMWSGHLSMSEIVAQQSGNFALHWHDATLFGVPAWNIFPQFPAFVVFFICALADHLAAAMVLDAIGRHDLGADHLDQLVAFVGPMQPGRDQDRDAVPRNAGAFERRQHAAAGSA